MDEMNEVNKESQPTTQPADNGNQGSERMFTQAEVDRIVKDRLARAKATPKEPTEAETRERELTARESRLSCREYLIDKGYPADLLDVIDTSDIEGFKTKADTVSGLLNTGKQMNTADSPERQLLKARIAQERGIPAELAGRLTGESEKELMQDAENLLMIVRKIKGPAPLASTDPSAWMGRPDGFSRKKHTPKQIGPYCE